MWKCPHCGSSDITVQYDETQAVCEGCAHEDEAQEFQGFCLQDEQ